MENKLQNCLFLLSGYELDGFPRTLSAEDSAQVLAGWVSLWHPKVLVSLDDVPRWHQAGVIPSELGRDLVVLADHFADEVAPDFEAEVASAGGTWFKPDRDWKTTQQSVLEAIGDGAESKIGDDWLADFAALGYAYLQIQLMTRQLRYTSNLDQLAFSSQAVEAAQAVIDGDENRASEQLQACFDALGQERDHYYSLDVNLMDVTLLASSTLGKSLAAQLQFVNPTSFLASASLLAEVKARYPDNFEQLLEGMNAEKCTLIGGLETERPHPLMEQDSLRRDLHRGREAYESLGAKSPSVFGRMSFGISNEQVAELSRVGFEGVFLTAWSEGSYPEGSQSKISWEASDGSFMSAFAGPVLDAADPSSFLSLGWEVGEALDHQHVPALVFAHWPGRECDFYDLLRRIAARTPALGQWMLADQFFSETDQPYHQERLSAPEFRFNWLAQQAEPQELIEVERRYQQLQVRCRSLQNLANVAWQLDPARPPSALSTQHATDQSATDQSAGDQPASNEAAESTGSESANSETETSEKTNSDSSVETDKATGEPAAANPLGLDQLSQGLVDLQDQADALFDAPKEVSTRSDAARQLADQVTEEVLNGLAPRLLGKKVAASFENSHQGRLIINPRSCPMRARVQTGQERAFEPESWNYASGRVGHDYFSSLDVPSSGFVLAPFAEPASERKKAAPLAEAGGLLQNEFLEAQVDSRRGHLRSLHVPARRGNRLSMMIAQRQQTEKGLQYSEMLASDVRMLTSSSMCGLVRAKGKLDVSGQKVGEFEIDYEVWRGSRVLEIVVRLSQLSAVQGNPWRNAFVARLAWPSEAASLRYYGAGRRQLWGSGRAVSPTLIEIDETDYRTHFLTGGLAFHRRTETRFLESIISADGADIEHRFGVGVDLPHPVLAARDFLDVRYNTRVSSALKLQPRAGWLATVDVKNVTLDLECPLVDEQGRNVGMRCLLAEWDGKSTTAKMRLMHDVAAAHRVNYLGERIGALATKADHVTVSLRANEQCCVDVLWAG